MDFVVIASTGGSVLARCLGNAYFRERIRCVVSDRPCGALAAAQRQGVATIVHEAADGLEFSDFLWRRFEAQPPDLFVSFYTRLFRGRFLGFAQRRLINVHPSVLPACPGRDGFGDTVRARARFIGATIHAVDEGVDTGAPIIQAAAPFDPEKSLEENRHVVFVQQCRMLLQVIKYVDEGRLAWDGDGAPRIRGARYRVGEYAPNLDEDLPLGEL